MRVAKPSTFVPGRFGVSALLHVFSLYSWCIGTASGAQMDSEQLQAYLDEPIEPPPAGVVPNLHNPANLNGLYIFTLVMCLLPATLAVWMRMFTKLILIRSFDYEDCKFSI